MAIKSKGLIKMVNYNAGLTIHAACEILNKSFGDGRRIEHYDIYYLEKTGKIGKIPRTTSGQRVFYAENLVDIKNAIKGLNKRRPRKEVIKK
jgi:hypothetical protein